MLTGILVPGAGDGVAFMPGGALLKLTTSSCFCGGAFPDIEIPDEISPAPDETDGPLTIELYEGNPVRFS